MANIGTAKVRTFGVKDLSVKLPSGTADVWTDIPSVIQASYKGSISEVEVYGDDQYQETWYHSAKGQISAKVTQMSMRVFEILTGNDAVSSGGFEQIQIGEDSQMDPPTVSVRCKIKCRNEAGTVSEVTAIFYRCRCQVTFESTPDAAHGKAGEVSLTFSVLRSTVDENNTNTANTLPSGKAAMGRLILPNT